MKKANFLIVMMVLAATQLMQAQIDTLWTFEAGDKFQSAGVAASPDGTTLYSGSLDDKLYAFSIANEDTLWTFDAGGDIMCYPVVDANGVVYFTSKASKLFAVNADGTLNFEFALDNISIYAPAILNAAGTKVYVTSYGSTGKLYCVDIATQAQDWAYEMNAKIKSRDIALSPDESVIYLALEDSKLHAVNTADGTQKWTFEAQGTAQGGPTVGTDGTIYFGSDDKMFYAVNPDGTKKWSYESGASFDANSAIDASGNIYVGSKVPVMYKFSPDGTVLWADTLGGSWMNAGLAFNDDESMLYVGGGDGVVYAINTASGDTSWTYQAGDAFESDPIVVDGVVYIVSKDKKIYALKYDTTATGVVNLMDENLEVYPNPATGIIHIPSLEQGTSVEIISLSGVVAKQSVYDGASLNVSDLAQGMYILKAGTLTQSIIIE